MTRIHPPDPLDRSRPAQAAGRALSRTGLGPTALGYKAIVVFIIAAIGLAGEIFFHTLIRVGREIPAVRMLFQFQWSVDPRLGLDVVWNAPIALFFGKCSLWMVPVYVIAALWVVRPLYWLLQGRHWLVRSLAHGVGITLFEGVCGLICHRVLGYWVWVYEDAGALFRGGTSLAITPLWCIVGLLVEGAVRELEQPGFRAYVEQRLARVLPRWFAAAGAETRHSLWLP